MDGLGRNRQISQPSQQILTGDGRFPVAQWWSYSRIPLDMIAKVAGFFGQKIMRQNKQIERKAVILIGFALGAECVRSEPRMLSYLIEPAALRAAIDGLAAIFVARPRMY